MYVYSQQVWFMLMNDIKTIIMADRRLYWQAGHYELLLMFLSSSYFMPPNLEGRLADRHQTLLHVTSFGDDPDL